MSKYTLVVALLVASLDFDAGAIVVHATIRVNQRRSRARSRQRQDYVVLRVGHTHGSVDRHVHSVTYT